MAVIDMSSTANCSMMGRSDAANAIASAFGSCVLTRTYSMQGFGSRVSFLPIMICPVGCHNRRRGHPDEDVNVMGVLCRAVPRIAETGPLFEPDFRAILPPSISKRLLKAARVFHFCVPCGGLWNAAGPRESRGPKVPSAIFTALEHHPVDRSHRHHVILGASVQKIAPSRCLTMPVRDGCWFGGSSLRISSTSGFHHSPRPEQFDQGAPDHLKRSLIGSGYQPIRGRSQPFWVCLRRCEGTA
jgi:hypothetical protein